MGQWFMYHSYAAWIACSTARTKKNPQHLNDVHLKFTATDVPEYEDAQ